MGHGIVRGPSVSTLLSLVEDAVGDRKPLCAKGCLVLFALRNVPLASESVRAVWAKLNHRFLTSSLTAKDSLYWMYRGVLAMLAFLGSATVVVGIGLLLERPAGQPSGVERPTAPAVRLRGGGNRSH